ncbi:hypothetical protein OG746_37335 [Streptomyces sp. NBC_01016]|uniref:hypothetical protein n=1 Tax=Streptomyces sp. NBC_01016 TaxID=2903720 RepID=UPI00225272C8|nr:hypothetical protein [Streptomyces sp. NBC_01016]MCX4834389.1 hypothetical protein [Streptomyces sp. NBC_01016]
MSDAVPRRRYSTITITIPGEFTDPDEAAMVYNKLEYAMERAGHPHAQITLPPVFITEPKARGYDGLILHRDTEFGSSSRECRSLDPNRPGVTWGSPRQLLRGLASGMDFPTPCPFCNPFGYKVSAALKQEDAYKVGIVRSYFLSEGWIHEND